GGFPATPPALGLDIVNPHYEANGSPKQNLTPNTFLAIEPGTTWHFVFFARAQSLPTEELLDETKRWLTEFLTQFGIGAKTAAGYGRFREPTPQEVQKDTERKQDREAEHQRLTRGAVERIQARETFKSDYPNEQSFKNGVLRLAANPGQWSTLEREIEK